MGVLNSARVGTESSIKVQRDVVVERSFLFGAQVGKSFSLVRDEDGEEKGLPKDTKSKWPGAWGHLNP